MNTLLGEEGKKQIQNYSAPTYTKIRNVSICLLSEPFLNEYKCYKQNYTHEVFINFTVTNYPTPLGFQL